MQAHEIDYTYLVSELQDAQGELEQHDARLSRIEHALTILLTSEVEFFLAGKWARQTLETPVSEFITK